MAKKKPEAVYECMVSCTFNMPMLNGKSYNHFYKSAMECPDESQNSVSVPAGTVVPKHFIPKNDQAKDDRKDQISNPCAYLEDKEKLTLIAEILVKEGFFNSRKAAEQGIREQAKEKDMDCDSLGEASAEETRRIRAIDELLSRGKDDKELRKLLGKLLKDGDVSFFAGAPPAKLAEKVYDNELYAELK